MINPRSRATIESIQTMHVSCNQLSAVIGDTMRLIKVIKLIPCLLQYETLQKYCDRSVLLYIK